MWVKDTFGVDGRDVQINEFLPRYRVPIRYQHLQYNTLVSSRESQDTLRGFLMDPHMSVPLRVYKWNQHLVSNDTDTNQHFRQYLGSFSDTGIGIGTTQWMLGFERLSQH